MKFLLALALAGLSLAQETTSTVQSTMVMTAVVSHDGPAPSSTPTAQQTCLAACAAGDVNCQAICVGVPHPSNSDMNSTTSCVAACDQGDGSKGATDAYASCRNNCISSYILLGTAKPAGASGSAASGSAGAAAATTTGAAGKNGSKLKRDARIEYFC